MSSMMNKGSSMENELTLDFIVPTAQVGIDNMVFPTPRTNGLFDL